MSNTKKRALIIAAICIVLGFLVSYFAFSSDDLDWDSVNTVTQLEPVRYPVKEAFRDIHVEAGSGSVRLLPSEDGKCSVVCLEAENIVYTVEVKNDTLTVKREDRRTAKQLVGIQLGSKQEDIQLYLPEESYRDLELESASGELKVPDDFSFETAALSSRSGDLSYAANAAASVTLTAASGEIHVSGVETGAFRAESSSGDIKLKSIIADSVTVSSTSGELELEAVDAQDVQGKSNSGKQTYRDLTAETLNTESSSGEQELKNVVLTGAAVLRSTSGDIELERCDAASFIINTNSGEVEGSLLSAKDFETHSNSGSIRVPDSDRSAGVCEIRTTSGDIEIRIAD